MEFKSFHKIPRLLKPVVITEKIDGTNGQIAIAAYQFTEADSDPGWPVVDGTLYRIQAGSRNRWITPDDDNYGFAAWVYDNAEALVRTLGPGRHFGEWWGKGINRGYGLDHRRFSLFRPDKYPQLEEMHGSPLFNVLDVVPVIYEGPLTQLDDPSRWLVSLRGSSGVESFAEPGYEYPEGVVIYHAAANQLFKVLCENQPPKVKTEHDQQPRGGDRFAQAHHRRIEDDYSNGFITDEQRITLHRAVVPG